MAPVAISLGISLATGLASSFLLSLLTPAQKVEGQRLNDLSAPKSAYGQQIPLVWGAMRVGGNVIWAKDIEEVVSTTRQGGKGGPKVVSTEYSYFGTYAAMLCKGPIVAVRKLWLNSRLVVDLSPEASDSTVAASLKFLTDYVRVYVGAETQNPDPTIQVAKGVGLTPAYRGRAYLVIERLPLADYGNAMPAVSAEVLTAGTKVGDRWIASPVPLKDIVQDICEEVGYTAAQLNVAELTDPVRGFWINAGSPAGESLGALAKAYFFEVSESGGVLRFVKMKRPDVPVSISLAVMGARAYGGDGARYQQKRAIETELPRQVSVVFPDPNVEYREGQQNSALRPGTLSQNEESVSMLTVLSASEAKTIADVMLNLAWIRRRSYEFNLGLSWALLEPSDLVRLPFFGTETAQIDSIRLGADLTSAIKAKGYASHIFDHKAVVKQPYTRVWTATPGGTQQLTPTPILEWIDLKSEDGSTLYQQPADYSVNLTTGLVTIANGGAIAANTSVRASYYAEESRAGKVLGLPGAVDLRVLDIPALRDGADDYGVYVAATGGLFWREALLYALREEDVEYEFVKPIYKSGIGVCVTTLGAANPSTIDRANTLRVSIPDGYLSSVTENLMLRGQNTALVGNELIRFASAQLVGPNQYDLKTLVRGVRGTQNWIGTHGPNEPFIFLDPIVNVVSDVQVVETTVSFKAIAKGQALEEVNPVTQTIKPQRLRPYPPQILSAVRTGSTAEITWARCDRKGANSPLFAIKPMSEAIERYRVTVVRGGNTINAVTVTAPQASLTGVAANDKVRVAQMSQWVGSGGVAEVTI